MIEDYKYRYHKRLACNRRTAAGNAWRAVLLAYLLAGLLVFVACARLIMK